VGLINGAARRLCDVVELAQGQMGERYSHRHDQHLWVAWTEAMGPIQQL
jgi:hypothetical protein